MRYFDFLCAATLKVCYLFLSHISPFGPGKKRRAFSQTILRKVLKKCPKTAGQIVGRAFLVACMESRYCSRVKAYQMGRGCETHSQSYTFTALTHARSQNADANTQHARQKLASAQTQTYAHNKHVGTYARNTH